MTRSVPTSASPLTTFVVSTSDVGDGTRARKTRFSASPDGDPLTYREVLRLWRADRAFRDVFLRALADEPHAAFFYETPPVTRDTLDRPYEHVITDAPLRSSASRRNPTRSASISKTRARAANPSPSSSTSAEAAALVASRRRLRVPLRLASAAAHSPE